MVEPDSTKEGEEVDGGEDVEVGQEDDGEDGMDGEDQDKQDEEKEERQDAEVDVDFDIDVDVDIVDNDEADGDVDDGLQVNKYSQDKFKGQKQFSRTENTKKGYILSLIHI